MLKQFVVGLVVIGLLFSPVAYSQQQKNPTQCQPPICGGGGGGGGTGYHAAYVPPLTGPTSPTSFSTSVSNGVASASVTAQNHFNTTSQFTASDYTAMATSLQTFFNEMDQTGATATTQAWILANNTLFTTNPSYSTVQAAYLALNKSGTAVSVSEANFINSITGTSLTLRQQFFTNVQQHGLAYVHSQIIANLNALAALAMTRVNGGYLYHVNCQIPWVGIGAAYFTIAALAISGPVGWGIGAVAAFAGVGSLFGLLGGC